MKPKILILLLTTYLFLGCIDEKDPTIPRELPPATQEGKGTAGCYINDELFVLSGNRGLQQTNPYAEFTDYYFEGYKTIVFGLSDFNFTRKRIAIYIHIKNDSFLDNNIPILYDNSETVDRLNEQNDDLITGGAIRDLDSQDVFDKFNRQSSILKFTKIDKINKILSGTFSFEVKNKLTGEILKIRDGRFDLKMNYIN